VRRDDFDDENAIIKAQNEVSNYQSI
jgi:hypothetical protein